MTSFVALLVFYGVMTAITLGAFAYDKYMAVSDDWRVPEKTLILLVLCGGAWGGLLGMLIFRHKTTKVKFWILVGLGGGLQLFFLIFFR